MHRLPLLAILLASVFQNCLSATLPLTAAQFKAKGSASIEPAENSVRLRFDDPNPESGVLILPPAGQKHWDLSSGGTLSVDIENLSADKQLRLTLHLISGDWRKKTERKVESGIAVNPGEKRTLRITVPHLPSHPAPSGVPHPKAVDSANLNAIDIFMPWPFEGKRPGFVDCRISNLRLEGEPVRENLDRFPFIDTYGQYMHADWPEKIRSDDDLKSNLTKEAAELDASERISSWNRFGGWADGPKLEATGNFRTAKHEGKWWLVDPEGRLFFSQGIDVLHSQTDATKTTNHEKWFDFPLKGDEVPFNDLNLRRKYGKEDYHAEFYRTLSKRLDHWGINTIGNWGHRDLIALGHTPYTLQLADYDPRLPRIAGSKLKFYDVFDPRYATAMKDLFVNASRRNPAVARSLTDPMCIGYFIDNELDYGNRGRLTLAADVLRSPATQSAKKEFVADLKARHESISSLNAAWETSYPDWDALLNGTEVPKASGYREDAERFTEKAIDRYFSLCHDAVKTAAPHRLYLGSRFISTDAVRPALFKASAKYCDVLTVNIYAPSAANFGTEGFPDMPVLIGEFHLAVRDRGLFSASSVPVGIGQEDRATAYTRFLQGALAHPNIVGAHWFQFRDQPLTGRWDGEGYPIGFVDVADTPYQELTRAARGIGADMYRYRSMKRPETAR